MLPRRHRKLELLPPSQVVSGQYIVDLHNEYSSEDYIRLVAQDYNITIQKLYTSTLIGFAAHFNDDTLDLLLQDFRVERIAQDGWVHLDDDGGETANEPAATTNLDMMDGRLDGLYTYRYTGTGSHIYVVDSGIRATHQEFNGRVAQDCFDAIAPCNTAILNPHGTHIASVAAGTNYGIAKNAILHDVRVLDETSNVRWSGLIQGVDYFTQQQQQQQQLKSSNNNNKTSIIVNMSLGGNANELLDKAVTKALEAGAIIVASAGNEGKDACSRSPGRVPGVITVGSISFNEKQQQQQRAFATNYGPCVDIWSLGTNILGAGIGNDTSIISKTGTSMAVAAVVGATALYMEAGLTTSDLLFDAAINVELAGNDGSPGRVLSVWKLNGGLEDSPSTTSPP